MFCGYDPMGPRVQPGSHVVGAVSLPSVPNLLPASWGHSGSTDTVSAFAPGTLTGLVAVAAITGLLVWRNPQHALGLVTLGAGGAALVLGKNYLTISKGSPTP